MPRTNRHFSEQKITAPWSWSTLSEDGNIRREKMSMLQPASIQEVSKLAEVKEGFGETDVLARFQWLTSVNVTWYVWWEDQIPCGWAMIHWQGKSTAPHYPDLSDLYVHPHWRNRGTGTQIVGACEQLVLTAGFTMLGLAVNPDLNPRAYQLYQRLGYSATSQDKYLDGVYNGVEDWVIDLEKELIPNPT
jgi:GNAT superfamily N-acetyltransferase